MRTGHRGGAWATGADHGFTVAVCRIVPADAAMAVAARLERLAQVLGGVTHPASAAGDETSRQRGWQRANSARTSPRWCRGFEANLPEDGMLLLLSP